MQHLAPEASKPTLLRAPKVGLNNGWKAMLSSLSVLQHRGWGGGIPHQVPDSSDKPMGLLGLAAPLERARVCVATTQTVSF